MERKIQEFIKKGEEWLEIRRGMWWPVVTESSVKSVMESDGRIFI